MPKIIIVNYEEDPDAIVAFRLASNYHWNNHINYTRDAIISILADLPDVSVIIDRLMKNQESIGGLLVPYYGKIRSDKLVELLKAHIIMFGEYIKTAKSKGNVDALNAQLTANAISIAECLDALDHEHWPKEAVLDHLNMHLKLTKDEISARINKDWIADITAYDDGHQLICDFADLFALGVVKKFPDKFVKDHR